MVRGAGHLNHMVAHIYQQVGRFAAGAEASKRAQAINDAYLKKCLSPYGMGHNLHVGIFNAVNAGQHGVAAAFASRQITAANDYAKIHGSDRSEPNSRVSPFSANLALVHLRFGRWAEALQATKSDGPCGEKCKAMAAYQTTTVDSKAHGVLKLMVSAFAAEAHGKNSDAQSAAIGLPPAEAPTQSLGGFEDDINRRPQIAIVAAQYEVAARRAFMRDDSAYTVAALRNLSQFLDAQPYMEPEPWYYDPRECLGHVLLIRGEPEAALKEFAEALRHRPRTPWALIGAAQAVDALGNSTAANPWKLQFRASMKDADVSISSSCPQYAGKGIPTTKSHLRR